MVNFHIEKLTNLERFGWSKRTISRIKRDVCKIIIMAFNEIRHFVAFYQLVILTFKETKYKKSKHTSSVLHSKDEIDLE